MKKRLKEIEEEAGALREMQAKVEKEMGAVQGISLSLSIYVFMLVYLTLLNFIELVVRESLLHVLASWNKPR